MTKVVDLQAYRAKAIEERGFGPWLKRFEESYGLKTRLCDLSDSTLYYLAEPGEPSSFAYYELIMGILDLGAAPEFYYLNNHNQMAVVDIHLFLADQVRFEMMRRLGWIINYAGEIFSLAEMIRNVTNVMNTCKGKPPELETSHPDYSEYIQLIPGEKEVFIRRKLQEALDTFEKRL